jgi:hypothetical protein
LKPVNWNRAEVWNAINKGKASVERPILFYRAAAWVVGGMLLYLLVMNVSEERGDLSPVISSTEVKETAQPEMVTKHDNVTVAEVMETKVDLEIHSSVREETSDTLYFTKSLAANGMSLTPDTVAQLMLAAIAQAKDTVAIVDVTPMAVEPVIGVYIPKTSVARKERKLKVQFFSLPERSTDSYNPSPLITARIK